MDSPTGTDLSREQVVGLFRDRDNDALRRHTGLVGTDGAGNFRVLCGCETGYGLEEWTVHVRAVVERTRRYKPKR